MVTKQEEPVITRLEAEDNMTRKEFNLTNVLERRMTKPVEARRSDINSGEESFVKKVNDFNENA